MGKYRKVRSPTRDISWEERLWRTELRKRYKEHGKLANTHPDDITIPSPPPSPPRSETATLVHQRPLKMKKKPKQPKKPKRRYTTLKFAKKEAWLMYAARAEATGVEAKTQLDDAALMDTVDAINEKFLLPPQFPPEVRAKYEEYDPLRLEPDMYNSHRRYATAGPQIMFKHSLLSPDAGVFMTPNRQTESLPLPYRPPYLTLLTAKSTAWHKGRCEAFRDDIIDFIEFSMDPLAYVMRLIDEEMQEMRDSMPAPIPECFLEEFLDDPLRVLEIQRAEAQVFQLAALYDFVMRLCEQAEDGRWDQAFPVIKTPRYFDPSPFAPGSRETTYPWFDMVPLSVYDKAVALSGDIEPPGRPRPRNHTSRTLDESEYTPKVPCAKLANFDKASQLSENTVKQLETLARDEFHMPARPCRISETPASRPRPKDHMQYHTYARHKTRYPEQSAHAIIRPRTTPYRVIGRPPPVIPQLPFLHKPYPPTAAGVEDPAEYEALIEDDPVSASDSDGESHKTWGEPEDLDWRRTQSFTYTSSTEDEEESSEGLTHQQCAFWKLNPIHHVKGYAEEYYNKIEAETKKKEKEEARRRSLAMEFSVRQRP